MFNVRSSIFCSFQAGKKQLVLFAELPIEFVITLFTFYTERETATSWFCVSYGWDSFFFNFRQKCGSEQVSKDQHNPLAPPGGELGRPPPSNRQIARGSLRDNRSVKGMKIQQKMTNSLYRTVLFYWQILHRLSLPSLSWRCTFLVDYNYCQYVVLYSM